ncbi:MAG: type II secretion system protein GspL [Pseudomonadota bacterium]
MSRRHVGIAIRDDSVAAVAVCGGFRGGRIAASASVPLADGVLEDLLPEALASLVAALGPHRGPTAVALPGELFHFRHLRVPFTDIRKIRQVLPLELETVMACAPESVMADFIRLPQRDENARESDLCVAAISRQRLEALLGVLAAAGIDPDLVTVGGTAMAVHRAGTAPDENVDMFIDAGSRQATLIVPAGGAIGFLRSVPMPPDGPARTQRLAAEINRTRWAAAHCLGGAPEFTRVVSTGKPIGLEAAVHVERFAAPVDAIAIAATGEDDAPSGLLESWCLALGLAAGAPLLNFRRGAYSRRSLWKKHKRQIVTAACLVTLAAILALGDMAMATRHLSRQVQAMDTQITGIFRGAFPEVTRIVDPLHQMELKLKEMRKIALVPGGGLAPYSSLDMLVAVSSHIPAAIDVELTRLVSGPEGIAITGSTDSFNAVDAIKNGLQDAGRFASVTITSASMEKSGNRVSFKLKLVPS